MKDFDKIDWSKYKLEIKCRGCSESLQLDDITEFQGELKKRTKEDIEKVVTSIYKYGFSFPFFIWQKEDDAGIPETNYCLDGHSRCAALRYMRDTLKVNIPKLPVVYIEADTEEEAKQKLLRLNSNYGHMTTEGFIEFVGDIEISSEEIELPDITFEEVSVKNKNKPKETKFITCPSCGCTF